MEEITQKVITDISQYILLSKKDLSVAKKELHSKGYSEKQSYIAEKFVLRSVFDVAFNRGWQKDGSFRLNDYIEAQA